MELKRMSLDSTFASSDAKDSSRGYTRYAVMLTHIHASHGIMGSSRVIPKVLTALQLRTKSGYLSDLNFDYMSDEEMMKHPELQPDAFLMHRLPKGTRCLGRKKYSDEEFFFQDFEILPSAGGAPTGAATAIDFNPDIDFIQFTVMPPSRKFTFYCGGQFVATVTLDESGAADERILKLLFTFKDGKCVEIENHIAACDSAVYAIFETELPVKFTKRQR